MSGSLEPRCALRSFRVLALCVLGAGCATASEEAPLTEHIRTKAASSACMVAILSRGYAASSWCREEYEAFLGQPQSQLGERNGRGAHDDREPDRAVADDRNPGVAVPGRAGDHVDVVAHRCDDGAENKEQAGAVPAQFHGSIEP